MLMNHILRPAARCMIPRGVVATRFAHSSSGKDEVFDQYHHMKNDTRGSFDEACVPEGDWNEHYSKKQKKYNLHLALGVATFVLTCTAILQGELLYFNYIPPTLDEEDLKELKALKDLK